MTSVFVAEFKKTGHDIADEMLHSSIEQESGISVLIGSDQMWTVMTGEIHRPKSEENLIAINSKFGWTFQGSTDHWSSKAVDSRVMVCVLKTQVEDGQELIRSFWELESISISDTGNKEIEMSSTMQHFEETIEMRGDRYEVSLPWKTGFELCDNKEVATTRLKKLLSRLSSKDGLLQTYDATIRDYLLARHAEVVKETSRNPAKVYYMPHKEVIREQALTTKVRVVFYASSRAPGCKSLNECLEKGDNLYQDLVKILLRFRTHPIAIMADIKKAFLQISIKEEDRDAFRFLWFEEGDVAEFLQKQVQEWRMTRVPFGATCSPFLLTATILHHIRRAPPSMASTAKTLGESFYVDDLVTGADTDDEAAKFCKEAQQLMLSAGMNLRKWTTNSR
ncbi:uncharacterized protein LOC119381810 [Rhipicephalus sanguineus]|uniref:uncharacterized protein LOC119381810 n=1 Tax=Rhipicephalus sanguineus TaxID=34632 RepID=UPI001893C650|nr:uncharacterized protein LOC119381810 [Rhipicephalus sanguineus]